MEYVAGSSGNLDRCRGMKAAHCGSHGHVDVCNLEDSEGERLIDKDESKAIVLVRKDGELLFM